MEPNPQTPSHISCRVGVTCEKDTGLLTELYLSSRNLIGTLPEGWSVLTDLSVSVISVREAQM